MSWNVRPPDVDVLIQLRFVSGVSEGLFIVRKQLIKQVASFCLKELRCSYRLQGIPHTQKLEFAIFTRNMIL